jgi:hypothetical protein
MTRSTAFIALTLAVSVAMVACQEENSRPSEPSFVVALPRSARDMISITDGNQLAELRQVTERFKSLDVAKEAGYATQITPCWAHHSAGAMGYHYGNTNLFDASPVLLEPEVVIYEPAKNGRMMLVGLEYIVPLAAWEGAGHDLSDPADVPQLLGQKFTRHSSLPIFKLHIWLWRNNPSGTYADWNPKVSCEFAESTETF